MSDPAAADSFTFQFDLSAAETSRANEVLLRLKRTWKSESLWLLAIFGPAVVLVIVTGLDSPYVQMYASMMFFLGLLTVLSPRIRRWQTARRFASMRMTAGPQTYTLAMEGIRASNAAGEALIRWDGIVKAVESSEFLLFYFETARAYYLPKRVIVEESMLEAVRQFIHSRMGNRARALGTPYATGRWG